MKRRGAVILVLCLCSVLAHARQKETPLVNYGLKSGFSSTLYAVQELSVAGMPINAYDTRSEISSFYTLFARLNARRHYVQTECSYNVSNYTIEFASSQWNPSALPYDRSSIGTKIIGLEVPLYYGYHIVQDGPYGMSFFAGPKAKIILTNYSKHHFEHVPYEFISEHVTPFNFSLMAGFGINIGRVFFDFSFEYGLHNISNGFVTVDLNGNESTQGIVFDRRKNVLSFSLGFMF